MARYWNRPEKTDETLRGGWLHTGDVGVMDAEGYVFMRGRLSERLLVDGAHWYPRDVEEVLLTHDAVRDAALIGVPDGQGGHRPLAFVTLHPGRDVEADALEDFVRTSAPSVVPGLRVEVIEAMPMTPTGKISKAVLLDEVATR
jgi:acyl-CoA synthetase (AMP-forming)/AMP-acid ligase II